MITVKVDSKELKEAFEDLKNYGKEKTEAVKHEVARASFSIDAKSKQNTPVVTGTLRRSHDVELLNDGLTGDISVGNGIDYAVFVHEGTSRLPARRFLFNAANRERNIYIRNITRIMRK